MNKKELSIEIRQGDFYMELLPQDVETFEIFVNGLSLIKYDPSTN